MLPEMSMARYVTLGNFSCNLCRNKISRRVARKIAWFNRLKRLIISVFILDDRQN